MFVFQNGNAMWILVLLFLKSSLIFGIALTINLFLKKRAASIRHFILVLAFISVFLLSFFEALTYKTNFFTLEINKFNVLSNLKYDSETIVDRNFPQIDTKLLPVKSLVRSDKTKLGAKDVEIKSQNRFTVSFQVLICVFWLTGVFLLLLKYIFSTVSVIFFQNKCLQLKDSKIEAFVSYFRNVAKLSHSPELLKSANISVPMTWGILRHKIVFPQVVSSWENQKKKIVVFHELSHIKRNDYLTLMFAKLVCVLFWFNPLCFIAFNQLKKEQEKACDQLVVSLGIKPSLYASVLVKISQAVASSNNVFSPVLSMSKVSNVQNRVVELLSNNKNYIGFNKRVKSLLFLFMVLFVIVLSSVKLHSQEHQVIVDNAVKPYNSLTKSDKIIYGPVIFNPDKSQKPKLEKLKRLLDKDLDVNNLKNQSNAVEFVDRAIMYYLALDKKEQKQFLFKTDKFINKRLNKFLSIPAYFAVNLRWNQLLGKKQDIAQSFELFLGNKKVADILPSGIELCRLAARDYLRRNNKRKGIELLNALLEWKELDNNLSNSSFFNSFFKTVSTLATFYNEKDEFVEKKRVYTILLEKFWENKNKLDKNAYWRSEIGFVLLSTKYGVFLDKALLITKRNYKNTNGLEKISTAEQVAKVLITMGKKKNAVNFLESLGSNEEYLSSLERKQRAVALNEIAWFFHEQKLKSDKAYDFIKKAISINKTPEYLDTYANLLADNKEYEKAINVEKKALQLPIMKYQPTSFKQSFYKCIELWQTQLKNK